MSANPTATPTAQSRVEPAARPNPSWPARLGRLAFWAAAIGLVAVNLVRLRDRFWPPLDLGAINRLIERDRLDAAEAALRDRVRGNPHDGEARLIRARLLLRRGAIDAAAAEFRLVPAWWPTKPEALALEGQAAEAAGRAVEAEAAWRACLADDPLHPAPPHLFSVAAGQLLGLLEREGRHDDAITLLWDIYEGSAPEDRARVFESIMNLRLRECARSPEPAGRTEGHPRAEIDPATRAKLARYAATDPADRQARRALALADQACGRTAEARRGLEAAVAARPGDWGALSDLLSLLMVQGDRERFGRQAARLAAPPGTSADASLAEIQGYAAELAQDAAQAAVHLERAVACRPADIRLLEHLGRLELAIGRDEAARDLRTRIAAIRAARRAFPGCYERFQRLTQSEPQPSAEWAAGRARVIAQATTLGWTREALVWERLSGPSAPQFPRTTVPARP